MNNAVLGELTFNTGWKTDRTIFLFGKEYNIVVKAKAYFEQDGVTVEQEGAFSSFCRNRESQLEAVENALMQYAKNANIRFLPRIMLLERDGTCALLFDDKEDNEGGIAVTLAPHVAVMLQDEYL